MCLCLYVCVCECVCIAIEHNTPHLPLFQETSSDPVEEGEDRETGSEGNKAAADTGDGDTDSTHSKDGTDPAHSKDGTDPAHSKDGTV